MLKKSKLHIHPSDSYAMWWHRFGPTLVQIMFCCLTASCLYLNQWWLTIYEILWYSSNGNAYLTHWGREKMDAISQTTFSNAFSWMKMLEYRLKFHWSLFLRVQLTISQHWFRQWLGALQATSHYLKQWWLIYRRIYASLGLNELSTQDISAEVATKIYTFESQPNLPGDNELNEE